jgi:phosphatidylglycerophosphatase C
VKQRIAFFDFDGTITTKDTLLEIIKFQKGKFRFYLGFLLNSPFLILYKMKIISNQRAKERILTHFFSKMSLPAFQEKCDVFALTVIPTLVRAKAMIEIEKLQSTNTDIVIVSASAENWIIEWCKKNNLQLAGTRLATRGVHLTGKIDGINCYGEEKVRRIKERYDLSQYQEIYCYGDTNGDKPMLGLATIQFYAPFR